MGEKETGNKKQIQDFYNLRTPIWIITTADDWLGGYINEKPDELFFYILDRKTKEPIKVLYSQCRLIRELEGIWTNLPLPGYIRKEQEGSQ